MCAKSVPEIRKERHVKRQTTRASATAGVRISDVINAVQVRRWRRSTLVAADWSAAHHVTTNTCRTPAAFAAPL